MPHKPIRTCIGCGIKKDKNEFIRIEKSLKNTINIDNLVKNYGRGAYICDNIECFEKAYKFKKIEKTFKMRVNEDIYERLKGIISDKK